MPREYKPQAVIFGGYRTETLDDSRAVETFLKVLGLDQSMTHANVWKGEGDSLRKRYERSAQWLGANRIEGGEFHILGYSMGCQLAVKFAQKALNQERNPFVLGSVTLVAPDPTHRRGHQDMVEQQQGIISAYDEARELWSVPESAGSIFTDVLNRIAQGCENRCRIVYCRADGVAEWTDNVERMRAALQGCSKIQWIETRIGEQTSVHGIRYRLDPDEVSHIDCADRVHAALWYRLNFETLTSSSSVQ